MEVNTRWVAVLNTRTPNPDILIFERRLQKRHDDLLKTQRNFRVAVFVVLAVMVVMLWAIYVQISEVRRFSFTVWDAHVLDSI